LFHDESRAQVVGHAGHVAAGARQARHQPDFDRGRATGHHDGNRRRRCLGRLRRQRRNRYDHVHDVLSEATKPTPNSQAIEWLRRDERQLVVDPIILGEIRFGIHLLPAGKRRRRLETWSVRDAAA